MCRSVPHARGPGSASPAALEPLRRKGYRLLWLSAFLWYFARWMDILVAGWLALELTNSPLHVALIGFYRNAPVPIFGAFAGAIADRLDRRLLVIAAEVANVAATLSVAVLLLVGRLEYWHLAAANLLLGLAWSVEWPSRRAMVPDLAGRGLLLPALVLDTMSMNVTKVLGPLVGGGLLAALSLPGCYVLLTLVYSAALVPLLALRLPANGARPRAAPAFRFVAEGLSFCHKHQPVRGVLLVTMLMNCFVFPYQQLLSVFARDVLQVGPLGLGLLGAGDGIGSLVGATALVTSGRFRRQGWAFVLGSVGMCAAILVFATSPVYAVSLAFLILGGVGHSGFSTFQSAIILGTVGDALRGRAMGVLTLAIGSSPLGMLLMGGISALLSAPWAVGLSSVVGGALIAGTAAATPGLLAHEAAPARPAASGSTGRPAVTSH